MIENHNIAHKFDLTGLKAGDSFFGCIKCQKIYAVNAVCVQECGNCLGRLAQYFVRRSDFGECHMKNEGDFVNDLNLHAEQP